jgi:hypothetical protein
MHAPYESRFSKLYKLALSIHLYPNHIQCTVVPLKRYPFHRAQYQMHWCSKPDIHYARRYRREAPEEVVVKRILTELFPWWMFEDLISRQSSWHCGRVKNSHGHVFFHLPVSISALVQPIGLLARKPICQPIWLFTSTILLQSIFFTLLASIN